MNALLGIELHLSALYESDERGRLLRCRRPSVAAAPRFHLARTRLGNVWRLRSDLEPALAVRLATLAGKEAALAASGALLDSPTCPPVAEPEREVFLTRALEASAPIQRQWAGPVFAAIGELAPPSAATAVRELAASDAGRLHPALGVGAEDLSRGGCIGAETRRQTRPRTQAETRTESEVVAVCQCVRGDGTGPTQAGVATAPEHRGRGHGAAVVRAWCGWVRARGGVALYSTTWGNAASRALAARLGLEFLGEDRHWT